MNPTIGEKIRELRLARGWTGDELARRAYTSGSSISAWEHGRRFPNESAIEALCKAFGVEEAVLRTKGGEGQDVLEEETPGPGEGRRANA